MLTLANGQLRLTVLDPVADQTRLGTRYCRGGYIWDAYDPIGRSLLSGPEGPAPDPNPFNGRGLPEAFRHRTREGEKLTWRGDTGLAIGIGLLRLDAAGTVVLAEPCQWTVTSDAHRLQFRTEHGDALLAYALERVIELKEREILSLTSLTNSGCERLELQWFAHPFFPLHPSDDRLAILPPASRLPVNPGLRLSAGQLSLRRRFSGADDGQFALLELPPAPSFAAVIAHPICGEIRFTTTFPPTECPVWANEHTFSIEPYQTLRLEPGETRRWALHYSFGSGG